MLFLLYSIVLTKVTLSLALCGPVAFCQTLDGASFLVYHLYCCE